jgi:hypothetical protein
MKILQNNLELVVCVWEDPGSYPNNAAGYPLPSYMQLEDIKGHLLIQIEKEDKDCEEWDQWGPELNLHYLMQDINIRVQGVLITSWQFCPTVHHDIKEAHELDMWKIVPYKWDSDNMEL